MISRRRTRRGRLVAGLLILAAGGVTAWIWMNKPPAGGAVNAAIIHGDDTPTGPANSKPGPELSTTLHNAPPLELNQSETRAQAEHAPVQRVIDVDTPAQAPFTERAAAAPAPREAAPVSGTMASARRALAAGKPLEARSLLNTLLKDPASPQNVREICRAMMTDINADLIFSPRLFPNAPLTETYTIQQGDSLSTIASRQGLATDWRLIQRVNGISDPSRIRVGQTLKLVRGPFHAIIDKSQYRMDIYAGAPNARADWVYIRSFGVGLGEGDSTPTGEFVIREDSKLINPHWVNPRTGERFGASNPENPIGERWLGLEGIGPYAALSGYGIHGTIEPASIGRQMSMGCVRLRPDNIALVYELLMEGASHVIIRE